MPKSLRRLVERAIMLLVALTAIAAVVAETFGWLEGLLPASALAKITLVVLASITVILFLELDRFHVIDEIKQGLDEFKADRERRLAGLVEVAPQLEDDCYTARLSRARSATVLNTWIPNLERLQKHLEEVVRRGGQVQVLLLNPDSPAVELRHRALLEGGVRAVSYDVRAEVNRCLEILSLIHGRLPRAARDRLQVRLYSSLPSISVYQADEQYLVSMFLHGQLAINSPQFDINGTGSDLGRQVRREIDTLWQIGKAVELEDK